MTLAEPLPRLNEQQRIEEWIQEDEGASQTYQVSNLSDNLPELQNYALDHGLTTEFVSVLYDKARKLSKLNKRSNFYKWRVGGLLSKGLNAWTGEPGDYWEEIMSICIEADSSWGWSQSALKRIERVFRRLENVPDIEKYLDVLAWEVIAITSEMVNDKENRYACKSATEVLEWALARAQHGDAPTADETRNHFLKDENMPNPWNQFRDGIKSLADKYLGQLPTHIQPLLRGLLAAIEAAERPTSHE